MGRSLKNPFGMPEPHYDIQHMPAQHATKVIETEEAKRQRVKKARQRTGPGRRP